ncbi:amino acid/polyamine/organocation transporter, APC superfamily [Agreia bicolorata]|uniref:Amino acid transporter n=1 Tax=Agreia bicolorata TaxID=110935 RepID=A0A1T4X411_9MICO|nr:APC family permease [Agreia bicolorata]KJC63239.1 amino acid transporter [Agreia bicolorata]SKA84393.1 amino acid/polyamine/organocation transporter, APC superfamily [Agreia bicolorata]
MSQQSTRSTPGAGTSDGKGLATGSLGLVGSVVIGLASTAPVYSLAATVGFVVLAVGAQAPIAIVLAFIPMFLTAYAYRELNEAVPDCGTSFTWSTKAFGPWVGWMSGWGVIVAGTIVLANLAQIGSKYFWLLIGNPDLYNSTPLVTATGVVFIAAMTFVSVRGLEIGEILQNILLGIQYLALILFVVFALGSVFAGTAPEGSMVPQADWFNPFAFDSLPGFTEAILLCLFIYWGWDTCLALNEETKDPEHIPGRAALLSTVILVITYVAVAVAAMAYAGLGEAGLGLANDKNAEDVFFALKDALFGPWAWLLVVAVMVSAISSTQTTILPTARGTLSMATYRALPERFGRVHPRFRTPAFSTIVMSIVASVFYVGMTIISDAFLSDTILSLGLAIAFYYAITSFACVWYFRRELFTSVRNFATKGLFPLLGGLMLTAAFVQSAIDMLDPDYGYTVLFGIGGVFVIGVGSLLVGAVVMVVWYFFPSAKPFFRGESLNRETPVLVPEGETRIPRSVDGGRM